MKKLLATAVLLLGAAGNAGAAATTINFDDTVAPGLFASTHSLTNEYAHLGVTFGGGGAILDQSGSFGVDAHSGRQFWAFNNVTYATGPGTISFDNLVKNVSIYAAGGYFDGTFTLNAYDVNHILLGSTSLTTATWGLLSIELNGIKSIELLSDAPHYVYDDLNFSSKNITQTPIPAAAWLFGSAFAGLLGIVKRKNA